MGPCFNREDVAHGTLSQDPVADHHADQHGSEEHQDDDGDLRREGQGVSFILPFDAILRMGGQMRFPFLSEILSRHTEVSLLTRVRFD